MRNNTEACSSDILHMKYLLKYHGIFQYTSFFLLVPLAISSAHYLRDFMPAFSLWGLRIWFHLHRTFNLLAVVFTIVGIILTFVVHKWRWIGPKEGCPEKPTASMFHAIFGIISVSILWAQPIGAIFRCSPNHYARKWFYYVHKTLGVFSWVLAAVTILIATVKFKSMFSHQTTAFLLSVIVTLLCIVSFFIGEFIHYNSNDGLWNNMSTSKSQSVKYSNSTLIHRHSTQNTPAKRKWKIFDPKYQPFHFIGFAIVLFIIWIIFITLVGTDKE